MTSFFRDFNHPVTTQHTNEGFQFPDSDYEEEGIKDGIVMFCGTIQAMKNAQEDVDEIDIPISDDENEEFRLNEALSEDGSDYKTKSTSTHVEPEDSSKNVVATTSSVTNTSWGAFDLEGDDEIPEIQSVKIRREMPNEEINKIEVNDLHYILYKIIIISPKLIYNYIFFRAQQEFLSRTRNDKFH